MSQFPKVIETTPELYTKVIALSAWYNAMPEIDDFLPGEQFHTNIYDIEVSPVPSELFDLFTNVYIEHIRFENGQVIYAFSYEGSDPVLDALSNDDKIIFVPLVVRALPVGE